jgi:hypothetical protein
MYDRKLLKVLLTWTVIVLAFYAPVFAQIKWDGGGGDGLWTTAANWSGNIVPIASDNVVLDNAFIAGNYTVALPPGSASTTIKTISITPAAGRTIELILPAANTAVPAFIVTGPGYGMIINNGGIFRNASGSDSGLPVVIADSLQINNGGRYIQNSDCSHAATIGVLSRAPGTEEGLFEFDIPGASNTISLSGRTYGKLVFSSNASPGTVTYTATGTNGATINSDLQLGEDVNFSLNLSDTLLIKRDLIQQGGVINLGNSGRTLITVIGRHMTQSAAGMITESGTAVPEIVLNGNTKQQIDCRGAIQNSIAFTINNMAGAMLMAPLSLPYLLQLQRGIVTTTTTNLLTLMPGCRLQVDSLSNNSFINGPVRIEGLSAAGHYLLPVGRDNVMRWLALKNATGNFTTAFIKGNPTLLSATYGSGIHHISSIEYWSIQADAVPAASAAFELSFNDPNSGGVTDMATLRASYLNGSTWMNAGNTGTTGSPGARGSVISNVISNLGSGTVYFALGSSVSSGNPLPLREDTIRPVSNNRYENDFRLRLLSYAAAAQVLTCRSPESSMITLVVYNISGTLVKTINARIDNGVNRLKLSLQALPAGIYYMRAFTTKRYSNLLCTVIL